MKIFESMKIFQYNRDKNNFYIYKFYNYFLEQEQFFKVKITKTEFDELHFLRSWLATR